MEKQDKPEYKFYRYNLNEKNIDAFIEKLKGIFADMPLLEKGNIKVKYPLTAWFTCNIPEGRKIFLENIRNSLLWYEIKHNCTFNPEKYYGKDYDLLLNSNEYKLKKDNIFHQKLRKKTIVKDVLECHFTEKLISSDFPKRLFNYLCKEREVECLTVYLPPKLLNK
ncbi:MAG TPA: hypothetical protein PKJ95_07030 [Atribacterota bacterium]|nr:hypothetical protein [Atribacterota bacterium]